MISEKRVFEDPLWIVAAILAILFIVAMDLSPEIWEMKLPDLSNPVIWFLLIIVAALGLWASRSEENKNEAHPDGQLTYPIGLRGWWKEKKNSCLGK
ncbi:MAG: hypothetical protein A2Z70_00760 [Chloroflexi bacterium RBG_13_48_17]|nr:MAG: hypothetical protein A2Z70_00760 [Chloroflexi bacterium RBG_13_48_17]